MFDLTIWFSSGNILVKSSENVTVLTVVFSCSCAATAWFLPTATASFSFCGLSKRNFCVGVNFSSSESNSLSNSLFFGTNEGGVDRRGSSQFSSSSSSSSSSLFLLLNFFNFSNLSDMVTFFVEGAFFICSMIAFSLLLTCAASEPIIRFFHKS